MVAEPSVAYPTLSDPTNSLVAPEGWSTTAMWACSGAPSKSLVPPVIVNDPLKSERYSPGNVPLITNMPW